VGILTWTLIKVLSDAAGRLGVAERTTWAPFALGAVLIAAGLYQLSPLKQVCLDRCRSPFIPAILHISAANAHDATQLLSLLDAIPSIRSAPHASR